MDLLGRDQWGARLALGGPMRLAADGVYVHHSVTDDDDDGAYHSTDDVVADMREIERIGGTRFGRFSYSYCGHPSGWVAEGAGLTVGAHTAGRNSDTFGYCLIGNYDVQRVTDQQVRAFREWRHWAVVNGFLVPDHWIRPHRDVKATACPGAHTMARWGELTAPPLAPAPPPPPIDWAALGRWLQNEHAHDTTGGPPVYMYKDTYQTDGVDPEGNLHHLWWVGSGWSDDVVAGPNHDAPDDPYRTNTAADPSAPVIWRLGMFEIPDRIDVQVKAADGRGFVHAYYTERDGWRSDTIPF